MIDDLLLNAKITEEGIEYPQYCGPLKIVVEAHWEVALHWQVDYLWRDAIGDHGCAYVLEVDQLIYMLPVRWCLPFYSWEVRWLMLNCFLLHWRARQMPLHYSFEGSILEPKACGALVFYNWAFNTKFGKLNWLHPGLPRMELTPILLCPQIVGPTSLPLSLVSKVEWEPWSPNTHTLASIYLYMLKSLIAWLWLGMGYLWFHLFPLPMPLYNLKCDIKCACFSLIIFYKNMLSFALASPILTSSYFIL